MCQAVILTVGAANMVYVKSMRSSLQTVDASSYENVAVCIELKHVDTPVHRSLRVSGRVDVYEGDPGSNL